MFTKDVGRFGALVITIYPKHLNPRLCRGHGSRKKAGEGIAGVQDCGLDPEQ